MATPFYAEQEEFTMAKMLDLTTLREQTMNIKLLDGEALDLRKPSQKLLLALVDLQKKMENATLEEQLNDIRDITLEILNNNKQGKIFTDLGADYDLQIMQAIIVGYGEFINEVMAQKN